MWGPSGRIFEAKKSRDTATLNQKSKYISEARKIPGPDENLDLVFTYVGLFLQELLMVSYKLLHMYVY